MKYNVKEKTYRSAIYSYSRYHSITTLILNIK